MSIGLGIGNSIGGKISGFGGGGGAGFQFGNALSFDGVSDETTMASAINKPALTAGFSISMWVKFYATPSNEIILGNSAYLYNQLIFVSPTQAYFRTRSAGASITYFNFPAISTGTWYYIAVSLVTTVNELWIDGVKYTGTTHNYDNENITFDQIGLSGTNYGQFVIDELALKVGSGLTQQDVDDLYNGGLGADATSVMTPDLYYKFDESEPSATTTDYSGNGNTGTVTGATFVPHTPTYDADAEAYFIAAEIPNATEQIAVNQLVLDLKGTGSTPSGTDLWTDAAAFYPISPTSLSAATYNLRDTTSFNMTWENSPTHGYTGVTFNGSNQYGDTGFNPNVETLANGYDITLGMQIVNASQTAVGLMSAVVSTGSRTQMLLINGNLYQDIHNTGGGRWVTSTGGTYEGRMIVSADRIANGGRTNYLNGTSLGTKVSESSGTPVNLSLFVGAQNNGSGGQNFTAIEMRFGLIIPKGIDATAVADLDDAIVRYNRTVLAGTLEVETITYIEAAGITDRVEVAAVNQLVKDLKGTGSTTNNTDVWTGLTAIYPVSPTSLAAAAYNLKDPAAFEITWFNSPTHSSSGVIFNGSSQYGDCNIAPDDGSQDDHSYGINFKTVAAGNKSFMGARTTTPSNFYNTITEFSGDVYWAVNNASGFNFAGTLTAAHYVANRDSSTTSNLYRDAIDISTQDVASTGVSAFDYFIGAQNIAGSATFYTNGTVDFAHIGAGLTANQAKDLYDAITTYNTALSR